MIYESSRSMTSSLTPEWARRSVDGREPAWELSWRPEPRLDRELARAAMELTELCSGAQEPGEEADALAARLDTTVRHVMAVLQHRRLERGETP